MSSQYDADAAILCELVVRDIPALDASAAYAALRAVVEHMHVASEHDRLLLLEAIVHAFNRRLEGVNSSRLHELSDALRRLLHYAPAHPEVRVDLLLDYPRWLALLNRAGDGALLDDAACRTGRRDLPT